MRRLIIFQVISYFSICISCYSQIPNSNFEDWTNDNNIENPLYWTTNNIGLQSITVVKELNAIQGNYSMKLSSTAISIFGTNTESGCAHVKFVPNQYFNFFNFCLRIDSIYYGQISIRIKQLNSLKDFERIGGWNSVNKTLGTECIEIPINQINLDTILIEIWALSGDNLVNGIIGYSEVILDVLSLSVEPNNVNNVKINSNWNLFENANRELVFTSNNVSDNIPLFMQMYTLQGVLMKRFNVSNKGPNIFNVNDINSGIYYIIITDGLKTLSYQIMYL